MSENIELRNYTISDDIDGGIEEYHEINHDAKQVSAVSKFPSESINNYDFFTQLDMKTEPKRSVKKKKVKKKDKTFKLMDMINTELASISVPITETVVEKLDDKPEYRSRYVQTFSREHRKFNRHKTFLDSERGISGTPRNAELNPTFPNLLEYVTVDFDTVPVEYVEPKKYSDLIEEFSQTKEEKSTNFLDIELRDIIFKHHHQYSLEDLLCMKLVECFKDYKDLEDKLDDLVRDIKVNRETKDNLKKDLLKVSPNKKDDIRFDATVRKYTAQLLQSKEKYKEVLKAHKEITHKIISIWSDVELVREKFECRVTPYNLHIKRNSLSNEDYDKEWNSMYEVEFTDMLAKIEYDYVTKCLEYREGKQNSKHGDNNTKRKGGKPKVIINEDEIKQEVEEIVNSLIVKDKLQFDLERDKVNTMDVNEKRNIYYFEIYVDNVFVCESERYASMDKWFNVNFCESFSVEIVPSNNILQINLLENDEKFARVEFDLTGIKSHQDFNKLEFVYDRSIRPTSDHVGSGHNIKEIVTVNKVRLKSSNIFKGNVMTACEVNIKIRWSEDLNHNHNEAIRSSYCIGNRLRRLMHGIEKPNVDVLTELIGKVYGKDVSNDEEIISTLRRLSKSDVRINDIIDLDEDSPEFVRMKLLHLRNSGGFTNVESKMVPIHGSQISTEQLNCLQKTKEKEYDIDYLKSKEVDMDPIELQRHIAVKYVHKLNKKILKNLNEHLLVKTQKDLVREFRDFSWRNIFSRESIATSSALLSNGSKHQILMESLTKEQDIHITVYRAFNLLDRSTALFEDGENKEETIAEPVPGYKVRPLRPFVRASYHGAVTQTVTAIGCHPTWNHTLKLSTKLDPLSSIHINIFDESKVSVTEDSGDHEQGTVRYRYCNKWLGAVQVPLYTVLRLGSLRGTFKIISPPIIFGYENAQHKESHSLIPEITQLMKKETSYITLNITTGLAHLGGIQEYHQPLTCTIEDSYIIKHINNFVTEYTNDFPHRNISLTFIDSAGRNKCVTQFLQPIPFPDKDFFPRNPKTCGSALSKSSGVSKSSSSKSSGKRREEAEGSEEKESVYSHEANWKGDGLVKTINACLRYVALIPRYEVCDTHVVTLTGLELLKVLHGSPLDHTLLLSSYFLYLGIKSWVAIGLGLPRGHSSYVLIQYDLDSRRFVLTSDELFRSNFFGRSGGYLWYVCDAVSGDRYELRDVGCPMKTVDYVFDNENIWVNIQTSQDCENVSFDLSKSSDWQPVFDKDIYVMKQPIVNDSRLYTTPSDVESLRNFLETKIKAKVQKWRTHTKTIWNRYCSGLLRESLSYWEYWSFNPSENKPPFSQKLKQLMVTYRMFGFPLNVPFTSSKAAVRALQGGAAAWRAPGGELALGVEVFPYPSGVLSVWVFLASLATV